MNRVNIRFDCETARNATMTIEVLEGATMQDAADKYKISLPRVHQILHHVVKHASPHMRPKAIDMPHGGNVPIWWLRNRKTSIIADIKAKFL